MHNTHNAPPQITTLGVQGTNGVVHGISRVLFPPPLFTKEQAIAEVGACVFTVAHFSQPSGTQGHSQSQSVF